jgi:hypothetical protein
MNESPDQATPTFDVLPYRESLYQLFLHGPTYDGDVISKSDRSVLVAQGLAERHEGYTYLTRAGVNLALSLRMDREKDIRQRKDRTKRVKYDHIEEAIKQNVPYKEKVESIVAIIL